jgi:hypothetical protein
MNAAPFAHGASPLASKALHLALGLLTDATCAGRRARLDPVPERQPRPGPARQRALGNLLSGYALPFTNGLTARSVPPGSSWRAILEP